MFDSYGNLLLAANQIVASDAQVLLLKERGFVRVQPGQEDALLAQFSAYANSKVAETRRTLVWEKSTLDLSQARLGDLLTLNDGEADLSVKLAGVLLNKSIIVLSGNDKPLQLPLGKSYTCRYFCGRIIHRFTTFPIQNSIQPYPHCHLHYPQEAEIVQLRKSARHQVNWYCTVGIDDASISGKLRDISREGCCVEIAEGSRPSAGSPITLFFTPEFDEWNHGAFRLQAIVRSFSPLPDEKVGMGVEFEIADAHIETMMSLAAARAGEN